MSTFKQSDQIKCGDHYLKAKVTFTEYRCKKYIDGRFYTLAEPPRNQHQMLNLRARNHH